MSTILLFPVPQIDFSSRSTLDFSLSVPSDFDLMSNTESPSLLQRPLQKLLLDKISKIPASNSDKLHPKKNEAQPYAEYVEEGLWKARVVCQKDHSFSVSMSKFQAESAKRTEQPIQTLDTLCEEELRRRFPNFQVIQGIKASIKDKFPILAKWIMGKTKFYNALTQKEVDQLKKQISFSACDRDDLVCHPVIEDPSLRDVLHLKDDAVLETQHLFAKNSPLNGKVFDRDGKIIHLSQGLASTSDRTVENTGNLRLIQTKNKESICYTGRPDSNRKALEQASFIFLNELKTNKKGITQTRDAQGNITYHLDYIVNSLLSAPWVWSFESALTAFPEREYIENEVKALTDLRNKGLITIEDPNCPGAKYQVKFNPILFSRSLNAFNRLENWLPPFATGESRGQEISGEGLTSLNTLAYQKLSELKAHLQNERSPALKAQEELRIKKIHSTLQTLERHQRDHHLLPEEELLVRDYLCQLLELPEVFHCKSSLDRTSIPVALSSTLKQWITLGLPEPDSIIEIIKDFRFKELFICNWMAGHQITRYTCNRKGTVAGEKLKTKILGFTLHRGIFQNPSIIHLVPERYLKPFPTQEKIKIGVIYALSMIPIMVLIYFPLMLLTILRNLAYIITLGKNHHWIGPSKFTLPVLPLTLIFNFTSIFPEKILNEDSSQIKDRKIIAKPH
jgi:hypothetical protein